MHKRSNLGATLTEVLIGIGFVATIIIAVASISVRCAGNPNIEQKAKEWGIGLGMAVQAAQCSRIDSDGDGYVSCTLSTKKPDGGVDIVPIECASTWSINDGCRMQKPGVVRGVQ